MNNKATLEELTRAFFDEYCKWKFENNYPKWSDVWEFEGELPHNADKGCYAHLNGDEVVYIGLAISDSNKGSGIGSRVSKYWKRNTDKTNSAKPYQPTVSGITGIITLPFPKEHFYLAAALEVYLIQNWKYPLKNKTHKKIRTTQP